MCINRSIKRPVFVGLAVWLLMAFNAHATVDPPVSIVGTFSGSGSEQCTSPLAAPENFEIQLNFNSQNGAAFTGTAQLLFPDGVANFSAFQGNIDAQGNITGGVFSGDGNGTFTGKLSGDTLTSTYSGTSIGCASFSGSFTAQRNAIGAQTSGNIGTGGSRCSGRNTAVHNGRGLSTIGHPPNPSGRRGRWVGAFTSGQGFDVSK